MGSENFSLVFFVSVTGRFYNKIVIIAFYSMKIIIFAGCMRIFYYITTLFIALSAVACNSWSGFKADDEMIARVGTNYLYRSELASSMPSGISAEDSVAYARTFTDKWIVDQLKQQEAEKLFSQSEKDIDRLVEAYRRSLLVRKLDQHYLEAEPCPEITDSDIAAYYKAHKGDFRISQPMVKGEIFTIASDYRRREKLLKLHNSSKASEREDFVEICRKNNFSIMQFNEWVSFTDYITNLPLLRTSLHKEMLDSRKLHQILYDKTYYYYRITDVLKSGDTMPLDMAKEYIRHILENRHRANVVHKYEKQIVNSALSSGHAKIYE